MCKAKYCPENHSKHYCQVCEDSDSDHCAGNCPEGRDIYHGTKQEYAKLILQNGFAPTENGRIGSGVYFTVNKEEAARIAKYKYGGSGPVVIECIALSLIHI